MIDITFDFRTDTSQGKDLDAYSPTLCSYHKKLWSKELLNGERMVLESRKAPFILTWKDFSFSSDSIIIGMWHEKNRRIIDQVCQIVDDPIAYRENLLRKSYTIGGMIVFPRHRNSMNQIRGMNLLIADRWDLTLECIRRHYCGALSPLTQVLEADKAFYDLFACFKGYVDFFLLQDCVSEDYSKVDIWIGDATFEKSGLPETVEEYFAFIRKEYEFLEKRNKRIQDLCKV